MDAKASSKTRHPDRDRGRLRWCTPPALVLSILIILLIAPPARSYVSQWSLTNTIVNAKHLRFIDISTGWAFSTTIQHTSDGGLTWQQQYWEVGRGLDDGFFVDPTHGWAVGDAGLIVATSDAGNLWTPQTSGTTKDLHGLVFTDAQNGWAVGDDETVLHTANGGLTWETQRTGWLWTLHAVDFYDGLHGCAVGANNVALYTTDGGISWTETQSNVVAGRDVHFTSPTHAIAVGGGGRMAETSDGGATWTQRPTGTDHDLSDIEFLNDRVGSIAGLGVILYTSDGGSSWRVQESPGVTALACVDINNLWAAGSGGVCRANHGGTAGASGWQTVLPTQVPPIEKGPATGSIVMTDETHGWAMGVDRSLLHTADGSAWTPIPTGASQSLSDLDAANDANVWAVGVFGDIVHTANGGATWVPQGQAGWQLTAVDALDAQRCWAAGWGGG